MNKREAPVRLNQLTGTRALERESPPLYPSAAAVTPLAQWKPARPDPGERLRFALISRDSERSQTLRDAFDRNFSSIFVVADPAALVQTIDSSDLHGIVIDCLDKDYNPIDVVQSIRPVTSAALIALTPADDDLTRILALESGADDCLGPNFNPRELLARLRAIVRRSGAIAHEDQDVIQLGDIQVNRRDFKVMVAGRECQLTNAEFTVLEQLMMAEGKIVTRDELTLRALRRELRVEDRSIDVHVCRLRQKLGPAPGGHQRIIAVRGRGYRIRSE